ncbi:hypothetical protein LCGC14_3079530, partial [marine sediment metagenome]
ECECDSSSHDVLESQRGKVPQHQHEVVIPETLESKRHLMKKNNVKQQIISTSQKRLAPKNRLHLSHMDQIYMDNDSLTISNHQLNGTKKKSIGIREESNLLFAFKKLSKYVDHKDEFSKTLNDSEHAKDLVNELQKIVDSIDKHRLEEKPAEHLKSTNALYSILDYEKISKMNKSKIVNFIVAVNFLSRTLQEHKYGENILKIIGNSNNSKLSPIGLNNGNTIDDPNKYQEQRTGKKFSVRDLPVGTGYLGNLILYNTTGKTLEIYIVQVLPSALPLLSGKLFKENKYLIYTTSIEDFQVTVIQRDSQTGKEIYRVTETLTRQPYKIYIGQKSLGKFGIPILKSKAIEM